MYKIGIRDISQQIMVINICLRYNMENIILKVCSLYLDIPETKEVTKLQRSNRQEWCALLWRSRGIETSLF